jgi:hypothetical protein
MGATLGPALPARGGSPSPRASRLAAPLLARLVRRRRCRSCACASAGRPGAAMGSGAPIGQDSNHRRASPREWLLLPTGYDDEIPTEKGVDVAFAVAAPEMVSSPDRRAGQVFTHDGDETLVGRGGDADVRIAWVGRRTSQRAVRELPTAVAPRGDGSCESGRFVRHMNDQNRRACEAFPPTREREGCTDLCGPARGSP